MKLNYKVAVITGAGRGKRPVKVLKEAPGFFGNTMQHAHWREAMSLVQAGIASSEDLDAVVKFGFELGAPFLGPLETADLTGLDLLARCSFLVASRFYIMSKEKIVFESDSAALERADDVRRKYPEV